MFSIFIVNKSIRKVNENEENEMMCLNLKISGRAIIYQDIFACYPLENVIYPVSDAFKLQTKQKIHVYTS